MEGGSSIPRFCHSLLFGLSIEGGKNKPTSSEGENFKKADDPFVKMSDDKDGSLVL